MQERFDIKCLVIILSFFIAFLSFTGCDVYVETSEFNPEYVTLAKAYHEKNNGVSFIILKDGKVVHESYSGIGSSDKANALASGTKSFSGIMAAFAIQDGLMKWDESVVDTLPEWNDDPIKSKITIRHLLTLSSGIKGESNSSQVPTYEEAVNSPSICKPDIAFIYDPAPFQIFGEIMRRKLESQKMDPLQYLDKKLFQPLDIQYAYWRRGKDDNPHMPSGAYFTAQNWAKFGEFIRNNGKLNGETLLNPQLIQECLKSSKVNPSYGITWWLNQEISKEILDKNPMVERNYFWDNPFIPKDLVRAAGAGGQRLYISQSDGWVIVRQALVDKKFLEEGTLFNDEIFLSLLLTGKENNDEAKTPSFNDHSLMVDDTERFFRTCTPSSYNEEKVYPLVIVFHGGGGNAASAIKASGWGEFIEKESFIAVFPEGTRANPDKPHDFRTNGQSWNDGSGSIKLTAVKQEVDDVRFVEKMIEYMKSNFPVDSTRVYATCFSNGGSMTFRVGRELSHLITAIAPVSSCDWLETPDSENPVSIMYITGTEDPLNPMEGGRIIIGFDGYSTKPPIEEMLLKWKTMLECSDEKTIHQDDDKIMHYSFHPANKDENMEIYYVKGLGHYWPGGIPMLPEWLVGSKTNIDALDGNQVIWDFFCRHHMVAETTKYE